jgi:hypothetical protein
MKIMSLFLVSLKCEFVSDLRTICFLIVSLSGFLMQP